MRRTFILLSVLACFLACSEESRSPSIKPPSYYNFFKEYALSPEAVSVEANELHLEPVGSELCGSAEEMVLCAQADWMAFTLEFGNKSEDSMAVHWDRARYVDENDVEHALDPRGEDMVSTKADSVSPGAAIRRTVDAVGKRKVRGSGEYAYVGYEPLLPWTHDEDPARTKRIIETLFTERVPVSLRIPISRGEEEKIVVWTFRLTTQQFQVL